MTIKDKLMEVHENTKEKYLEQQEQIEKFTLVR